MASQSKSYAVPSGSEYIGLTAHRALTWSHDAWALIALIALLSAQLVFGLL